MAGNQWQPAQVLRIFPAVLALIAAAWVAFEGISRLVPESGTDLDHRVVLSLRSSSDPGRMAGPEVLEEMMRDFTALGGYAVLVSTILCFSTYLSIRSDRYMVRFFVGTCVTGYIVSMLMKKLVGRDRPSIVPHLSHVETSSFPSTHSMMSVITFLTIGVLVAWHAEDRRLQRLALGTPLCLTLFVGISRVCMGVHFPTDVLAGWCAGLLWSWACFSFAGNRLQSSWKS
ncbi:MAG: phosphatase PAP2 family protein [Planctomyces sp.]|nr:phosphatase PAP2 family protein [Planctomyces sp.]